MPRRIPLLVSLLLGVLSPARAVATAEPTLLQESFDDADLARRGWYDGKFFRIAGEARAGAGCVEYAWQPGDTAGQGSSGARHALAPTDEVYLRFYLKLSRGWGWSRRPYHPHLVHDVVLRSTDFPAMKFNQFLMTPYFGPGLLPHAQQLWIDELVIARTRIGPLPLRDRP